MILKPAAPAQVARYMVPAAGGTWASFAASGTLGAPTPLALMRSRFTAFALHDAPYLLASWHPHTRPAELTLDENAALVPAGYSGLFGWSLRCGGHGRVRGVLPLGPGTPAEERVKGAMHEKSRFEKVHGTWYYLDGEVS